MRRDTLRDLADKFNKLLFPATPDFKPFKYIEEGDRIEFLCDGTVYHIKEATNE